MHVPLQFGHFGSSQFSCKLTPEPKYLMHLPLPFLERSERRHSEQDKNRGFLNPSTSWSPKVIDDSQFSVYRDSLCIVLAGAVFPDFESQRLCRRLTRAGRDRLSQVSVFPPRIFPNPADPAEIPDRSSLILKSSAEFAVSIGPRRNSVRQRRGTDYRYSHRRVWRSASRCGSRGRRDRYRYKANDFDQLRRFV